MGLSQQPLTPLETWKKPGSTQDGFIFCPGWDPLNQVQPPETWKNMPMIANMARRPLANLRTRGWMELDRTNNKSLTWHLNIRIMWDFETWKLYETIMFKFHLKLLVHGFVWSWFGSHYPLILCKLFILPCVGLPCLVLIKATYHILIERDTSME